MNEFLPIIPIILPLLTAIGIQILGRFAPDNIRDGFHTTMAIINFYFVFVVTWKSQEPGVPSFLESGNTQIKLHNASKFLIVS